MSLSVTQLIARYERLSTPVVYDVLDKMGYPNVALTSEIRSIAPDMVVFGPALTIQGAPYDASRQNAVTGFEVFRLKHPDAVWVMATNGHRISGPWGENSSLSAKMTGARGIVIDGGTRDANAIVAMGFPTFCRYLTPVFGNGRYQMIGYQQPVQIAGQVGETVTVHPGDFVMADRDGVVIIPQALVEDVLVAAEKLEEIEVLLREGLQAGEDREAVYAQYPKFNHVRRMTQ